MSEYLTEQEQIQLLVTWLKRYLPTVLLGIVIAIAISGSWRYWQYHRTKVLTQASIIYDQMLSARAQNNQKFTQEQANTLLTQYSNTPYAEMAALLLARDASINKDYPEAIKQLDWVTHHANNRAIRQIARLRQARILITEKQPEQALSLLKKINDKAFMGLIDEIRGDAYVAMNNAVAARKAYEVALAELPNAQALRPILQMKFDHLTTGLNQTS